MARKRYFVIIIFFIYTNYVIYKPVRLSSRDPSRVLLVSSFAAKSLRFCSIPHTLSLDAKMNMDTALNEIMLALKGNWNPNFILTIIEYI